MQPVIVEWLDAHQGEGYWHALSDNDMDAHLIRTCGWLLTEADGGKPGHVTVAQNIDPNEMMDHVIFIPSKMVERIIGLEPIHVV